MNHSGARVAVVVLSHRWRTHPEMVDACMQSVREQTLRPPLLQVAMIFHDHAYQDKLNRAIQATDAPFVLVVPDDDLLRGDCTAAMLDASDEADLVYSDRRVFADGEEPEAGTVLRVHGQGVKPNHTYAAGFTVDQFRSGMALHWSFLIRRRLGDDLKWFDPIACSDTDFLFRAVVAGARFRYVAKPLVFAREHAAQDSKAAKPRTLLDPFFRKHFLTLGVVAGKLGRDLVIPEAERVDYATTHYPELVACGT